MKMNVIIAQSAVLTFIFVFNLKIEDKKCLSFGKKPL